MSTLTKPTRFLDLPASRVKPELGRGTDVWSFFNPLVFPQAVNLGQGFMNWKPPAFVLDEVVKELHERTDLHHYSHPKGRPRLRAAVQAAYSASFHKPPAEADLSKGEIAVDDRGFPLQRPSLGVPLDVEREIAVTAGANEAMYSIMCAFLEEGDEVVLFEPFFDQYVCEVSYNGGVPVYVPMLPPQSKERVVSANEWTFDWELLEQKLASPKAKALFLNTPHNPIGKVCTLEELQRLAQLCIKYDILVVADEVYDCLTYDGHEHIRIASLEGMWERTLTVGSAGKSFSCTGWRVGWMIGPPHLIAPAFAAHVRITFSVNSGSQEGAAIGLEQAEANDFFPTQVREYESRRAELLETLDALNFTYTLPHGSYFVLVDASSIQIPADFEFPDEVLKKPRDYHMCWFIAKICDVVSIPVTAFYSDEGAHVGERYIRFAFCKDNQIVEAGHRLQQVRNPPMSPRLQDSYARICMPECPTHSRLRHLLLPHKVRRRKKRTSYLTPTCVRWHDLRVTCQAVRGTIAAHVRASTTFLMRPIPYRDRTAAFRTCSSTRKTKASSDTGAPDRAPGAVTAG